MEISAELLDPLKRQRRVSVGIELPHGLLGLPHGGDVAAGVAGAEQAE